MFDALAVYSPKGDFPTKLAGLKFGSEPKTLWQGEILTFQATYELQIPEKITAVNSTGDEVAIGLNTGEVVVVDYEGNQLRRSESRFPEVRETLETGKEETGDGIHGIFSTWFDIKDVQPTGDGKWYDASMAGIFREEERLEEKAVTSFRNNGGNYAFVPLSFAWEERYDRPRERGQAGDLLDFRTRDTLIERFTPFDGSGGRQAEYVINGGAAYLHHGNWPGEKISVVKLSNGEKISQHHIMTSGGFVTLDHKVYDFRVWPTQDGREVRLTYSDSDYNSDEVIARPDDGFSPSSAISFGDRLVIASTNHTHTKIQLPDGVLEMEGVMKLKPLSLQHF